MTTGTNIDLTRWIFVGKVLSLFYFNFLVMIIILIDNTENDRKKAYVSNDTVFKIVLPRMPLLSPRYFRYAFA